MAVGLIQLQVLEVVLAEQLHHPCVPHQITLEDRRGRKAFEESWLQSVSHIVAIAEALHEIALLRSRERTRGAVRVRLRNILPNDLSARQPSRVFSGEPLTPDNLTLVIRR